MPALVPAKLVGLPLVAFALVRLFAVPAPWDATAVMIAALPTGTGPFMLARLYARDAAAVSHVILFTTCLSALGVPMIAALMG